MSAIEFRSVDKIYRGRRVIDALSFMIEAGERIVLFGPSGCGKSTTLLLIAGLVAPDAGEIRIDGKVVSTAGRIHVGPAVARRRDGVSGSCALAAYERCRKHRLRTSRPAYSELRMQAAHKRHRKPCRAWRLFGRAAGRTLRRRAAACRARSRSRLGASASAHGRAAFELSMTRSAADCAKKSCACMPSLALRSSMSHTAARKQSKWVREQSSLVEAAAPPLAKWIGPR